MATASRAEHPPRSSTGRSDPAKIIAFPDRAATTPSVLARLLEQEIIPRLVFGHRRSEPASAVAGSAGLEAQASTDVSVKHEDVSRFAQAATTEDADALLARVQVWRAKGYDDQTLCLELLAPAAKLLGFMWEEDLCSFADVTVGLGRLQQVLQAITDRGAESSAGPDRSVLLSVVPGEQHVFGMLLAADAFRRGGWRVAGLTDGTAEELRRAVSLERFDLVGLSAVQDVDAEAVKILITSLRRASLNPDLRIAVGGRFFDLNPHLVAVVGADGGAEDARASVATAERLVARRLHLT